MAGGLRAAARWLGCLALMAAGPWGGALLLVWLGHDEPRWFEAPAADWGGLILAWAVGLLGIHLLPLRALVRAVVAVLYTPVAAMVMLYAAIGAGCAWYGACP